MGASEEGEKYSRQSKELVRRPEAGACSCARGTAGRLVWPAGREQEAVLVDEIALAAVLSISFGALGQGGSRETGSVLLYKAGKGKAAWMRVVAVGW